MKTPFGMPLRNTLLVGLSALSAVVWACGGAGLSSTYLSTTCVPNGPSYGSTQTQYSPTPLYNCTSLPGSTNQCVHGTVTLYKKVTVYSNDTGCGGNVVSTTGWIPAGGNPYAYDSLCACPS